MDYTIRCDGSGWLVTEDDHISCPGCFVCPENADLMDRLEEAEGDLISWLCDDEPMNEESLALLLSM